MSSPYKEEPHSANSLSTASLSATSSSTESGHGSIATAATSPSGPIRPGGAASITSLSLSVPKNSSFGPHRSPGSGIQRISGPGNGPASAPAATSSSPPAPANYPQPHVQTSGIRKRASRAGTRSVTTMSAAQLERKRANDREAQRAIRQRTKEHIEQLEQRISELSSAGGGSNEQLFELLRRNKELEEENAQLRAALEQAHFALGMSGSAVGGGGMSAQPPGSWEDVPSIKVPVPSQHHQASHQHQSPLGPPTYQQHQQQQQISAAVPFSAAPVTSTSSFSRWRSPGSNEFQSPLQPRSGPVHSSSDPSMISSAGRWGSPQAQGSPHGTMAAPGIHRPQSHQHHQTVPDSMDYSYMVGAAPTAASGMAVGPPGGGAGPQQHRAGNQTQLYNSIQSSDDQRQSTPTHQIHNPQPPIPGIEMGHYGAAQDATQAMILHQHEQQQQQSQTYQQHIRSQSQHTSPSQDSVQQQAYYGPVSRR